MIWLVPKAYGHALQGLELGRAPGPKQDKTEKQTMKIINHKQKELAMDHLAELLKRDGWMQTKTIQQWLDSAELQPAQFQASLPALQILSLLGFENDLVRCGEIA